MFELKIRGARVGELPNIEIAIPRETVRRVELPVALTVPVRTAPSRVRVEGAATCEAVRQCLALTCLDIAIELCWPKLWEIPVRREMSPHIDAQMTLPRVAFR